jgi:hypothetical protein
MQMPMMAKDVFIARPLSLDSPVAVKPQASGKIFRVHGQPRTRVGFY